MAESALPPDPFPAIYDELRRLAKHHLKAQRRDHTLQPTALVHEVYLRLVSGQELEQLDRTACLRLAARAMRSVLVDHARTRNRQKRKASGERVMLDEAVAAYEERALDLVALDEALEALQVLDERLAALIDLRFFGGLSVEQTAAVLGVSARTIKREWQVARGWLYERLSPGERS
ncbi:MAG: ECF-type sigma factor [Planctomycetota bacterium]